MPDPTPELATSITASETDRLLQAEQAVRNYCGWHIAPLRVGEQVTVVGSGRGSFLLRTLHLVAVTAVTFPDALPDEEPVDLTQVDWTLAGEVTDIGAWWIGRYGLRRVTLTFDHGHATVPADVAGVVQAVAQRAVANPRSEVRSQAGPFSSTPSQAGFNQAVPLALFDAEKDILRPYRIPNTR